MGKIVENRKEFSCDKRKSNNMAFYNHFMKAPIENEYNIHSRGQTLDDGRKMYSKLQLKGNDYSCGTGDKAIKIAYNFEPRDIITLKNDVCLKYNEYQKNFFKVVSMTGQSPYSACQIRRNPAMRNPWQVTIINGTALNAKPINNDATYKKISQNFSEDQFVSWIIDTYNKVRDWENAITNIAVNRDYSDDIWNIFAPYIDRLISEKFQILENNLVNALRNTHNE